MYSLNKLSMIIDELSNHFINENTHELGIDKRLAITKQWTAYREAINSIQKIYDAARKVGLDGEVRKIIKSTLGSKYSNITKDNPLTFDQALSIEKELNSRGLIDIINNRDKELSNRPNDVDDSDPESDQYKQSLTYLKDKTNISKPSIQKVLNPHNMDINRPLSIRFRANKRRRLVTINSDDSIAEAYGQLRTTAKLLKFNDLYDDINRGFVSRSIFMAKQFPNLDDKQRQYYAMWLTLYNVGQDIINKLEDIQAQKSMQQLQQ